MGRRDTTRGAVTIATLILLTFAPEAVGQVPPPDMLRNATAPSMIPYDQAMTNIARQQALRNKAVRPWTRENDTVVRGVSDAVILEVQPPPPPATDGRPRP